MQHAVAVEQVHLLGPDVAVHGISLIYRAADGVTVNHLGVVKRLGQLRADAGLHALIGFLIQTDVGEIKVAQLQQRLQVGTLAPAAQLLIGIVEDKRQSQLAPAHHAVELVDGVAAQGTILNDLIHEPHIHVGRVAIGPFSAQAEGVEQHLVVLELGGFQSDGCPVAQGHCRDAR